MDTISIPLIKPVRIGKFKAECFDIFSSRFIDVNETSEGVNITLYLTGTIPGDDVLFNAALVSHSASELTTAEQQRVNDQNAFSNIDIAEELLYLDTTISAIDTMTAAQVRDVVKRLCQENRVIIRILRLIARSFGVEHPTSPLVQPSKQG